MLKDFLRDLVIFAIVAMALVTVILFTSCEKKDEPELKAPEPKEFWVDDYRSFCNLSIYAIVHDSKGYTLICNDPKVSEDIPNERLIYEDPETGAVVYGETILKPRIVVEDFENSSNITYWN